LKSEFLRPQAGILTMPALSNVMLKFLFYLAAPVLNVKAHSDHVTQIQYISSIDRVVSASRDRSVCLMDPESEECTYFYSHVKSVECMCFVSAYSYMASSGQERQIQVRVHCSFI
jgi:WD40 repeat protein